MDLGNNVFNMIPKVLMNKSQIQTSFENSLFKIFILPKLNVNKKEFNIKPNVIGLKWKAKKKILLRNGTQVGEEGALLTR